MIETNPHISAQEMAEALTISERAIEKNLRSLREQGIIRRIGPCKRWPLGVHQMNFDQPERATQDRVLAPFKDELNYRYLGDWTEREGNSNIDEAILGQWLAQREARFPETVIEQEPTG